MFDLKRALQCHLQLSRRCTTSPATVPHLCELVWCTAEAALAGADPTGRGRRLGAL